jgi:hypothetical protein
VRLIRFRTLSGKNRDLGGAGGYRAVENATVRKQEIDSRCGEFEILRGRAIRRGITLARLLAQAHSFGGSDLIKFLVADEIQNQASRAGLQRLHTGTLDLNVASQHSALRFVVREQEFALIGAGVHLRTLLGAGRRTGRSRMSWI